MKDGYQYWCKRCIKVYWEENQDKKREYLRKYHEENREKHLKHGREHYDENKELYRSSHLQRTYGISLADYDSMLITQKGKCAICGMTPEENGQRLSVDHDHATGEIRALLCNGCNRGLGGFRDSPILCGLAMSYLYKYGR